MKVLVCGGRNYNDYESVKSCLDMLPPITCIISGCARGADTLGIRYAEEHNIPIMRFPADWNTYGKAAGSIRNQQMLDEGQPQLVIAFPGGSGTADMVRRSLKANLKVYDLR